MKKIIRILTLVCCAVAVVNFANFKVTFAEANEGKTDIKLKSLSELEHQLEDYGIDKKDSDLYSVSLLISFKEINPNKRALKSSHNIYAGTNEVDACLKEHRRKVKKYYSAFNESMVKTLGLDKYDYYASLYSPYVEITFNDLEEYKSVEKDIVGIIEKNKDILASANNSILSNEVVCDSATVNSRNSSLIYFNDALNRIGVTNSSYTGDGVRVGIIESGVPDSTVNLNPGKFTFESETTSSHATVVTSIIGGTSGIAENVYFYCVSTEETTRKLLYCFETLLSYNVDIINMSAGITGKGEYDNYCSYVDNITSNYNCTFVTASGNNYNLKNKNFLWAPACSMNSIAVGSIDYNQNISYFSGWETPDAFLCKPDVVAPGGNIYRINNIIDAQAGTSFSAPMLTGTIALLMEEFPVLKENSALVKSVVHLGAEELPTQATYFDQQAGFGLINYPNMRKYLQNLQYADFTVNSSAKSGAVVKSLDVDIPYSNRIDINANLKINSDNQTLSSNRCTPRFTNYSIKLFSYATSNYVATSNINSSVEFISFTNNSKTNTSYRIDIFLKEDYDSIKAESGSFAYDLTPVHLHTLTFIDNGNDHMGACTCGYTETGSHNFKFAVCTLCGHVHTAHSYDYKYEWNTDVNHKSYCLCGDYNVSGHVVAAGTENKKIKICLLCKGPATLGGSSILSLNELYHTDNGSYILHNGVTVLVDEDIEAFMAGLLKFYKDETI